MERTSTLLIEPAKSIPWDWSALERWGLMIGMAGNHAFRTEWIGEAIHHLLAHAETWALCSEACDLVNTGEMNSAYTQGEILLSFSSLRPRRLPRRPSDGTSSVTGLSQSAVPSDHRQYIKCIFNICFSRFNEENLVSILQALLPEVFESMDSCLPQKGGKTMLAVRRVDWKGHLDKITCKQKMLLATSASCGYKKRCLSLFYKDVLA